MSIETLPTPTPAQLRHLANLAAGRGCPADVASVLDQIDVTAQARHGGVQQASSSPRPGA